MTASRIVLDLAHGPGNPRNSEGAFVTLADGRIMFAYSRYDGDDWSDHAPARIAARFSADGGETWSAKDVELVGREGRANVMSVSLLRLADGRIGLWYMRKNSLDDCTSWLRRSADEAATWDDAVRCIPAAGYFVCNNDRVVQLSTGRLVLPASYHFSPAPNTFGPRGIAMFFLSDDGGDTWRQARDWWACPVPSASGLQEPGLVERRDGSLYAWARTDLGCQYEMTSTDGGEQWSPPRPSAFRAPCSPLSMKRLPTGNLLAIWDDHSGAAHPHDPTHARTSWGRTPLVAAVSTDDGRTWHHHRALETDPARGFCYTAVHCLDDAVLLAYCCGGADRGAVLQDTCIRRVDLDWFSA